MAEKQLILAVIHIDDIEKCDKIVAIKNIFVQALNKNT